MPFLYPDYGQPGSAASGLHAEGDGCCCCDTYRWSGGRGPAGLLHAAREPAGQDVRHGVAVGLQHHHVAVAAEASFHATYDECTIAFLTQAGAKPDVVRLADQGLHGNGHMMMLETNSDAVADVLAGWIAGRVK